MSSSLAVGIVCFPSFGGSGVVASELADGLSARGNRVHLFSTAWPGHAVASAQHVRFHEIQVPSYPLFEHAPYTLAVASKLMDVARAEKLDIIHVHYAVPHAASGYLARQLLGTDAPRLVTSLHGTDVTRVGADPSYRSVTSAAVAASDGVIVPSDFLRREARTQLQLAESVPIEVIPNFVDAERFAPAARRDRSRLDALFGPSAGKGPVLVHVSNFRPVKRPSELIEVLSRVRRQLPARLVLVGDGPERGTAEARARALGLGDAVRFLGIRRDFVEWLPHADAFLLTSENESFGVAALEALSAGVPVFAYRVGGLPEVVSPGAGWLVEPLDVEALARAVVDALSNPGALEVMGQAARRDVVERFRREPALDRYEEFYRQVLT
ncbi:MAG: N-acetyl-alpha-D-glucosaminyl L-malate synthase BshA [Myxococcaceae bacterium]